MRLAASTNPTYRAMSSKVVAGPPSGSELRPNTSPTVIVRPKVTAPTAAAIVAADAYATRALTDPDL